MPCAILAAACHFVAKPGELEPYEVLVLLVHHSLG